MKKIFAILVLALFIFCSCNKEDSNSTEPVNTAPQPPSLLSPSDNATGISVPTTLSWNASSGAASYTLQVSTSSSFGSYAYNQSGLTGTSQQVSGLSNNTKYYWRVSATNSYGTSSPTGAWNFTTVSANLASISGKVTNSSNQAIANAKIYTTPVTSTVYSDASGDYTISNINAGTYTVNAEKTGYNNYSVSVTVSQGQAVTQNIVMTSTGGGGSSCAGIPTVTYSGKTYNTVQIGNQCWLKENLDVGVYTVSTNTGSSHSDVSNNGIIEKYCYGNIEQNCNIYGGLYDWNEAMGYTLTPGTQGICPPGWHIPTLAEFEALKAAVNNDGNALKAIGQGTGNGVGTNTSGFSALLAGDRFHLGYFDNLGYTTGFWSSTECNSFGASYLGLDHSDSSIYLGNNFKEGGFSVRCVKD